MKNLVIFASGSGSNAEKLITHFNNSEKGKIVKVLTNNPQAGVISKAQNLGIETITFTKSEMNEPKFIHLLESLNTDLIILAGFLLKIPTQLVEKYPNKIINIHPALLPKYGGKGMYGINVHRAVLENNEKESGITIHYVNENYDEGNIIFQAKTSVENCASAEEIAKKVLELEHQNFPIVIENLL